MARFHEAKLYGAYIRFPQRCTRCNGIANKTYEITVMSFLSTEHGVQAPICRRCYRVRKGGGIIIYTITGLFFISVMVIILGILGILISLVLVIPVIMFFHDYLDRFLNRRIIGVWGVRVSPSEHFLTLRFSDISLGQEVEKLTEQELQKSARGASEYEGESAR